jgi:hypothetical protein
MHFICLSSIIITVYHHILVPKIFPADIKVDLTCLSVTRYLYCRQGSLNIDSRRKIYLEIL